MRGVRWVKPHWLQSGIWVQGNRAVVDEPKNPNNVVPGKLTWGKHFGQNKGGKSERLLKCREIFWKVGRVYGLFVLFYVLFSTFSTTYLCLEGENIGQKTWDQNAVQVFFHHI